MNIKHINVVLLILCVFVFNACVQDDVQIHDDVSPSVILVPKEENADSILYYNGKSIAIIGDSYSTYGGWIPSGYPTWYAIKDKDGCNKSSNDVNSVKQTWWWKLCYECGFQLLMNSSYSGSTICYTGYNKSNVKYSSFITRAQKDFGDNTDNPICPDIIIVFGGTNDSWADVPIGSLKYEDWTEDDLKSCLPSICYLYDYLVNHFQNAQIINITNYGLKNSITNGMKEACNHYGIDNVILNQFEKQSNHPSINGMEEIKNQIIESGYLSNGIK